MTQEWGYVLELAGLDESVSFWRNGFGWNRDLRKATVFRRKNDAIQRCVGLGSKICSVKKIKFSVCEAVYPPSKVTQ